jgi:hypothetical protein
MLSNVTQSLGRLFDYSYESCHGGDLSNTFDSEALFDLPTEHDSLAKANESELMGQLFGISL